MPAVPYNPTPTVAPSNQAIPGPSADVPAAAFGSEVADAASRFGRSLESSANELFGRAVALQNLNNETEAAEAETKFMIEAGQLHAEFNALEGKDRVQAFSKYQKDLEALRAGIGGELSNPMSQKLYTTRSRSTLGRTLFNGAGAAATANKQWTKDTVTSQLKLDIKTVEDNPKDEGLFYENEQRVVASARNLAAQQGAGPGSPQEKLAIATARSELWAQRIIGLSRTNPFEAKTLFEKNKGMLISTDALRVDSAVTTQARAVGSTNIANEVWAAGAEGPDKPQQSLADMEAAAERRAKQISPDDPILAKQAISAVQHKFNQAKYATTQERATNEQIVLTALQSGVKNEQELLADPKVAAAYEALPSTSNLKKKPISFQLNQFNTQRDLQDMQDNSLRLRGLALTNPLEFLNSDLAGTKLSFDDRKYLLGQREKIIKQQGGDLRVFNAMSWLRSAKSVEMQTLGLYTRDKDNPQDYDKFTGALQGALDDYIAQNKRPADYKTVVEEIGPNLLKTIKEPGWLWGTNETKLFKPANYGKDYDKFDTAYKTNFPQATDEQTYKAYQRFMYQKFYGKKGE